MHGQRRQGVPSRREWLVGVGGLVTIAAVTALAADGLVSTLHSPAPDTPAGPGSPYGKLPVKGTPTGQGADGRFSATVNAAGGRVVLRAGTVELFNFADPDNYPVFGAYLRPQVTGLTGAGIDTTTLQMRPRSSTKGARVPAQSTGSTNPLFVLRTDKAPLSGFTLLGTTQGHPYNGIELFESAVAVTDVKIKAIPGDAAANPGETFSISDYRGTGNSLTRVEVDGYDTTGKRVGASGVGLNYTSMFSTADCYVHGMAYGAGITYYQTTGMITHTRARSIDNVLPFNFERCVSTVEIVGCTAQRNRSRTTSGPVLPVFAVVDSDLGSSVMNIHDPIIDSGAPTPTNPLVIVIHASYRGRPQAQKPGDIHLFLNGVERPDCLLIAGNETLPSG